MKCRFLINWQQFADDRKKKAAINRKTTLLYNFVKFMQQCAISGQDKKIIIRILIQKVKKVIININK